MSKKASLYEYLSALGVLEKGSAKEIKEAKLAYRKAYLKHYAKDYLKDNTTVSFWVERPFKQTLLEKAKSEKKSCANYIKEILYNHISGKQNHCDKQSLYELEESFSLAFDRLEDLVHENPELKPLLNPLLEEYTNIEVKLKILI